MCCLVNDTPSLRSMAVLSSRAQEWCSREKNNFKLLPPQSPRGFFALARLYYLARPTKTAMLRRLRYSKKSLRGSHHVSLCKRFSLSINLILERKVKTVYSTAHKMVIDRPMDYTGEM